MMRFIDKWLIRRRGVRRFSTLSPQVRHRLALACRELSEAEQEIAARLDLPQPPRLLIVDEEEAVILTPSDRTEVG